MTKLIINLAPTGMIPTKKLTPHVPVSPSEIISDVLKCAKLGVSIVHLHARDENGVPSYKTEIYAEIIKGIRRENRDLILCVSTSGRNFPEFEKRSEVLELTGLEKPDMASLTLSSLNFVQQASINTPKMIQNLAKKMLDNGIKPELESFDFGMINYSKYLIKKGLIEAPYYINLLLGNIAGAQSSPLNVGHMLSELPPNINWALAGIGSSQLNMNITGIIFGGGVRVGLEDNIWYDNKKSKLATNFELVSRVTRVAKEVGREIASPKEVRKKLGLLSI